MRFKKKKWIDFTTRTFVNRAALQVQPTCRYHASQLRFTRATCSESPG